MTANPVTLAIFDEPPKPWGFWATVGLSAAVFGLFTLVQFAVGAVILVVLLVQSHGRMLAPEAIKALGSAGWVFAISTWVTWPPCLLLIWWFTALRRLWTVSEYLALTKPRWGATVLWLLASSALSVVTDWAAWRLKIEVVPEFQATLFRTAVWPPGLWTAVIIAAPVGEELFFRGFMFRGIEASRLGAPGAILLTSLAFAALHLQYDQYHIGVCFIVGLLLGLARVQTRSTTVPMFMHAVMNLIAAVETEWVL